MTSLGNYLRLQSPSDILNAEVNFTIDHRN
jgi:hypothetical protein